MIIFVNQTSLKIAYKFSKIVSLEKLQNINQMSEDKQFRIRETYIYQEELNRARSIINKNSIKLDDYIGTGDKSFTVAGKKIEASDDSYVILRTKGLKSEFPEFYTTQEIYQPFQSKYIRDAEKDLPDILKNYLAITHITNETLLKDKVVLLKKWLDKNKIPGKNVNEQMKRVFEYEDDKFNTFIK